MNFPPLPTWESTHPLAVHLPIGALPVAMLLAAIALLSVRARRAWSGATLLALAVGVGGLVLATASGDAAEHAVVIPESAGRVFSRHEHLGQFTENVFLAATALYTLVWVTALIWNDRCRRALWMAAHIAFLAIAAYGMLNLANTGHLGARLVHEFGVRAPLAGSMDPADRAREMPSEEGEK